MTCVRNFSGRARENLAQLVTRPGVRLSAGKLTAGMLSACWIILLVREIDKSEFAIVVLVLAFSALTSLLHDGGQLVLLAKAVALQPTFSQELASLVFRRRIGFAIIALTCASVVFSQTSEANIVVFFLIWPSVLATVGYSTIFAVIRVSGSVDLEAKSEFYSRLALIVLGCILLYWGLSAPRVIAVYSVIDVLSFLVVYKKHGNLLSQRTGMQAKDFARQQLHWRVSAIVSLTSAFGLLLARVDPIFISALRSDDDVATFAVGVRFIEFLIVPVGTLVMLKVSNFAKSNSLTEITKTVKMILIYSVGAVAVLQVVASMLPVLFGSDYGNAVTPLRILAFAVFPMSLGSIFIAWLILKSPTKALISLAVGLSGNVVGHLVLTSKYGPAGAAFANLSANSAVVLTAFFFFQKLNKSNLVTNDKFN
jgi:O-antigen/teichoic acid export membrane protein